jgi:hypothetical protein
MPNGIHRSNKKEICLIMIDLNLPRLYPIHKYLLSFERSFTLLIACSMASFSCLWHRT